MKNLKRVVATVAAFIMLVTFSAGTPVSLFAEDSAPAVSVEDITSVEIYDGDEESFETESASEEVQAEEEEATEEISTAGEEVSEETESKSEVFTEETEAASEEVTEDKETTEEPPSVEETAEDTAEETTEPVSENEEITTEEEASEEQTETTLSDKKKLKTKTEGEISSITVPNRTIELTAGTEEKPGDKFKIMEGVTLNRESDLPEESGVYYRVWVKSIKSPKGGSYAYYDSTDFSNDVVGEGVLQAMEQDKNKAYTIVYGVQKSNDTKFRKYTWVPEIQAVTTVKIKGNKTVVDQITKDEVFIKSLKVEVEDGTRPWDDAAGDGNDTGADNGIVRTFDKITYDLIFNAAAADTSKVYKDGYVYVEADIPLAKDEAVFDTNSMGFMEKGWQLVYYDIDNPSKEYEKETDVAAAGVANKGQRLKFFYRLEESTDQQGNIVEPFPCSGAVPITLKVYRMKKGDIVQPTFRASIAQVQNDGTLLAPNSSTDDLSGNRNNKLKSVTARETVVTCAPSYNIQLRNAATNSIYNGAIDNFDFSTGNGPVGNNPTGETGNAPNKKASTDPNRYVYGQMQSFGVALMLFQKDKDKGLRGVEFPTEPIKFDIKMNAYFLGQDGTKYTSDPSTPVLWDAGANESIGYDSSGNIVAESSTVRSINSGRDVYGNMTGHSYASYAAPRNNASDTRNSPDSFYKLSGASNVCWNGGKWKVIAEGGTLHVTVSDFVINPQYFPSYDWGYSYTNKAGWYYNPAIGVDSTNIGVFSTGEFYVVVPHSAKKDGTGSTSNNWANTHSQSGQMHIFYEVSGPAGYSFNSESNAVFSWDQEVKQGNARDNQNLQDLTQAQIDQKNKDLQNELNGTIDTSSTGTATVFYSTDNKIATNRPMLLPGGWNNHIWYTTPDNWMQGLPTAYNDSGMGLEDKGSMDENAKEVIEKYVEKYYTDRIQYGRDAVNNAVKKRKEDQENDASLADYTLEELFNIARNSTRIGGDGGVGGGVYWDATGNGDANHVNGSDEAVLGNKIGVIFGGFKNTKDGSTVVRENQLLKFDASVLTPYSDDYRQAHTFLYNRLNSGTYPDGSAVEKYVNRDSAAGTNPPGLNTQVQYGYKKGSPNSNWANQAEMNNATESDLDFYGSLQEGKTCVAIRMLHTNMQADLDSQYQHVWNIAYFKITDKLTSDNHIYGSWADASEKSSNNVNYVAPVVMLANAWGKANASATQTTQIITDYGTGEHSAHGFKQPAADGTGGNRWYEKASYASGAYNGDVKGNTGLYAYDGDSLRLRSFTTTIAKRVESKDTYDLSDEEDLIADFKIIPEFNVPSGVSYQDNKEVVVVNDILPAGMAYREGSSTFTSNSVEDAIEYIALEVDQENVFNSSRELSSGTIGGEYFARADGKHSRVVATAAGEPAYVEPFINKLSGDRTQLTWVLYAVPGEDLPVIHYSVDMQQTSAALNGSDSMVNVTNVQSKTEKAFGRAVTTANGNQASATIKLKSPRLLMPIKVADQAFTDTDGTLGFSPRWTNMMPAAWKNAIMMDTMPTNNTSYSEYPSFTPYHGSYTIVDNQITFKLPSVSEHIEDYDFYYTVDEQGYALSSAEYSLDIVENEGQDNEANFTNPNKTLIKKNHSAAYGTELTLYSDDLSDKTIRDSVTTKTGSGEDAYSFNENAKEGVVWKKAKIEYTDKDSRSCVAHLDAGDTPSAWFIFGTIPGGKPITANVKMKTKGSKNGDVFTNAVSVEGVASSADAYIVNRQLEGVVWIDANYNGIREDDEELVSGVTATLYKFNNDTGEYEEFMVDELDEDGYPVNELDDDGNPKLDENNNFIYKQIPYTMLTDEDGHYLFNNLPEGTFLVRFSDGDTDLGEYRATLINVGDEEVDGTTYDSDSDSDAYPAYSGGVDENGLPIGDLESADIPGISMIPASQIVRSPYQVKYQDFGIYKKKVPEKEYGKESPVQKGDPVNVGDQIPFVITAYNDYVDKQVNVVITDILDKGYTYDEGSAYIDTEYADQTEISFVADESGETGGTITWTIYNVPSMKDKAVDGADLKPVAVAAGFSATVNKLAKVEHVVENEAIVKVGNDSESKSKPLENPVPEKNYTKDTPTGAQQGLVAVGDIIGYEIFWRNTERDDDGNLLEAEVYITDVLDKGLTVDETSISEYGTFTPDESGKTGGTIVWNFKTQNEEGSVTFEAEVNNKAEVKNMIENTADVRVGEHPDFKTNTLRNPVPSKKYTKADDNDGYAHALVNPGDKIKYDITYYNLAVDEEGEGTPADVTVIDVLDKNLIVDEKSISEYGTFTPDESEETGGTITWVIPDVAYDTGGIVQFAATVAEGAKRQISNRADVIVDNGSGYHSETKTNPITNPVPDKQYSTYTPSGSNQTLVQLGDTIKYDIFYGNEETNEDNEPIDATVVITDVIDKGLTVDVNSITNGGTYDEKTHTITWTFVAFPKEYGYVSFAAIVNDESLEKGKVENTAKVKVGNHPDKQTRTLVNPIPIKRYANDSAGKDGGKVKEGDIVKYEITYANYLTDEEGEPVEWANIQIVDEVDKGLEVDEKSLDKNATFKKDSSGKTGGIITWNLKDVKYGFEGFVSFSAKVKPEAAGQTITNEASVKVGNNPKKAKTTNKLTNKVDKKTTTSKKSPRTGDDQPVALYAIILLLAAISIIFTHSNIRRRRYR